MKAQWGVTGPVSPDRMEPGAVWYGVGEEGAMHASIICESQGLAESVAELINMIRDTVDSVAAENARYVVRHYDGFDETWTDITGPLPWLEASRVWNERTEDGTKHTKYADIDYYNIFPADTEMLHRS